MVECNGFTKMKNDDLGPLLAAPPSYLEVRNRLRDALGFPNERRPLLIGIEGLDGSGKSALAAWLSWQLDMPAVHLDLYVVRGSNPLTWRTDDLARVVDARRSLARPVIVEGILLLNAMDAINRKPDFLVFVEKDQHQSTMEERVVSYLSKHNPQTTADYVLRWSSAEYDRRVGEAHLH